MKIKTHRLDHPYIHGLRVHSENNYCDIVRTRHGAKWHVYMHGFPMRTPLESRLKIDMNYRDALKLARKIVASRGRRADRNGKGAK